MNPLHNAVTDNSDKIDSIDSQVSNGNIVTISKAAVESDSRL